MINHKFTTESSLLADINELKKENEQLKLEIQELKKHNHQKQNFDLSILGNLPGINILTCNTHGKIININQSFELLVGFSNNDLVGKNILELLIPKEEHEKMLYTLKLSRKLHHSGEISPPSEIKLKNKDNSINRFYSLIILDYKNSKSPVIFLIGFDISSQKNIIDKIVQNEENLRLIIDNQNAQIVKLNPDGQITYASKTFAKYHGKNILDFIGVPFIELFSESEHNQLKIGLFEVQFYPYFSKYLQKIPRKHFNRWLEWVFNGIRDKDNNLTEVVGVAHDISDEMIVKELLQKSEANLRAMLNNQFVAFILIDENYNIQTFNTIAYEWLRINLGIDIREGLSILDVITKENDQILFFDLYFQCINGQKANNEIHLEKSNSWFEINLTPVKNKETEIFGVCITAIDISKRKLYEKSISDALEKEKELNDIKSRLVSAVSHEFRTPLAIISSSAQLIQSFYNQYNEEQKENQFTKLFNAIKRTTNLLDEILLINYEQSKLIPFNPQDTNLLDFCLQLIEELKLTTRNDVQIKFNFKVVEPIKRLDENILKHILRNLISNAVKYSKVNGEVVLDVNYSRLNNELIFKVIDNGLGIHPEDLKKIYEPFFRGRNVSTINGTGIGMAIVKRFIDIHLGKIEIDSQINLGTKVKVTLPL